MKKDKLLELKAAIKEYEGKARELDSKIFYDYKILEGCEPEARLHLMIGPLNIFDSDLKNIVETIAKENDLKVGLYDFNTPIWSSPRNYQLVFYRTIDEEDNFREILSNLYNARKTLKNQKLKVLLSS